MDTSRDWSGQQLAEYLAAVSSYGDEAAAIGRGVERAAEAVEAEVGAMVRDGRVIAAVGFPAGRIPEEDLRRAAAGEISVLDVPGAGPCSVLSIALEELPPSFLVLARSGEVFSAHEAALLRAMVRVLSLGLRMLRTLEAERASREATEHHAEENARLLASLQERQELLERLFTIQRSISHRAPITEVLDAITGGAAELLRAEVVGLRLIDPDDPNFLVLASSVGTSAELAKSLSRSHVHAGVGGAAITARQVVVTHDYGALQNALPQFVADGLQVAMAAPVFQDGEPIGSLVVASYNPSRRWEAIEQEVLLAFAEHASLALNDASALEAMRKAYAEAVHLAHHDTLTGLPNRALVLDRLDHALVRGKRHEASVGVLFVDLDRFKVVNDTLGHSVGDEVLIRIGERLRAAMRPEDTVGRLSGDEFVVVCDDMDPVDLLRVADRVAAAIEVPLPLYGRDTVITASIGIAAVNGGGRAEDVLRDADVAMYRAKEQGRARIEVFDEAVRARLLERLETEHLLRRALGRGELRLDYQPIVRVVSGDLGSFEALVRWNHPERGLVAPDEFIPLAEDTGLIIPIGQWVLREACAQLSAWRAASPTMSAVQVSVNLSAKQFNNPDIVATVADALALASLPAAALTLEITESVLMEQVEATAHTLQALKDLGVGLSIDDFGTGYSSLSYLKRFPVDVLKIDRSFVDGLGTDADDHAIVGAVVSLAHALGLSVVAEGVETTSQLNELRRLGCDSAQGYLLGRPEPSQCVWPKWGPRPRRRSMRDSLSQGQPGRPVVRSKG